MTVPDITVFFFKRNKVFFRKITSKNQNPLSNSKIRGSDFSILYSCSITSISVNFRDPCNTPKLVFAACVGPYTKPAFGRGSRAPTTITWGGRGRRRRKGEFEGRRAARRKV